MYEIHEINSLSVFNSLYQDRHMILMVLKLVT